MTPDELFARLQVWPSQAVGAVIALAVTATFAVCWATVAASRARVYGKLLDEATVARRQASDRFFEVLRAANVDPTWIDWAIDNRPDRPMSLANATRKRYLAHEDN